MKIKRIKKDYQSKEEMPEELRKDFYSASVHLSACWMLKLLKSVSCQLLLKNLMNNKNLLN